MVNLVSRNRDAFHNFARILFLVITILGASFLHNSLTTLMNSFDTISSIEYNVKTLSENEFEKEKENAKCTSYILKRTSFTRALLKDVNESISYEKALMAINNSRAAQGNVSIKKLEVIVNYQYGNAINFELYDWISRFYKKVYAFYITEGI